MAGSINSDNLNCSLTRAKALGNAISDIADEIERTRRIPASLLEQLHEARLCRMLLPRSFGGDEISPETYFLTIEAVAWCDASVAWNLFVANSAALLAAHLEPKSARKIFQPKDALVAWGPPNSTVAAAEPGGYRITGQWDFASGCRNATWMGAHCRVREMNGKLRKNRYGQSAVHSMLFPAEQAILIDTWDTIGLRGTASDSYKVNELFVPEAFTGTREEPDARREPGSLYAFPMQGIYAVGVSAVALGVAGAMLCAFKELANAKTPRGSNLLADCAAIKAGVAEAEARLGASRAYIKTTLSEIYNSAELKGAIGLSDRARVRLSTSNGIQGGIEVADWVYKQAGVDAIFGGSDFQRRFRDIHTLSQQIQSRDAHFEAVGAVLLGQKPSIFY